MPGLDIRIDDPTIPIDTSLSIMIDSAFQADPFFVLTGGVQGLRVISVGPLNTAADALGGDKVRSQGSPGIGVTLASTFDSDFGVGITFDRSISSMDLV